MSEVDRGGPARRLKVAELGRLRGLTAASALIRGVERRERFDVWSRSALAGRLAELVGEGDTAALTLGFQLVRSAQEEGETVAWVGDSGDSFFPPDVERNGVDLEALAVVRVPGARNMARVADRLLRSGGFGLVVLDLGRRTDLSAALQTRLSGLAQKHDTAVLCLTVRDTRTAPLGALVQWRGEARRCRVGELEHVCSVQVVKDKRGTPGGRHEVVCRGPDGV